MSQRVRKKISLNRKLNRLKGYDYTKEGWYFVTICLKNRFDVFGNVVEGKMVLNDVGIIVRDQWLWLARQYDYVRLDEYIVMPDHFHGIIIINPSVVVGGGGRDMSRLVPNPIVPNPIVPTNEMITQDIIFSNILTGDEDRSRPVPTTMKTEIITPDEKFVGRDMSRLVPNPCVPNPNVSTKIKSLSELIGAFKSVSSKLIHQNDASDFAWQRSFHDHIIHTDQELLNIRKYIYNNPINKHTY